MAEKLLRQKLAKLAKENPELRKHIVPILRKTAADPSYKDYVEKKKKKGEKPLKKDQWESRVLGKGKAEKGGAQGLSKKIKDNLDDALKIDWREFNKTKDPDARAKFLFLDNVCEFFPGEDIEKDVEVLKEVADYLEKTNPDVDKISAAALLSKFEDNASPDSVKHLKSVDSADFRKIVKGLLAGPDL